MTMAARQILARVADAVRYDRTHIAAWSVAANFTRWARAGWQRRLAEEPDFPVTVWAIARKP